MTNNRYSLIALAVLAFASSGVRSDEFRVEVVDQTDGHLAAAQFANAFGCTGGNVSPLVRWSGAPAGTQSYVVTMYDPDAPTGSGWWHWTVANIPAEVRELPAGVGSAKGPLPVGATAVRGDAGSAGYFGACPPVGEVHRYEIAVHALKVAHLDFPADASPALVGYLTHVNRLAKAMTTLQGAR